MFPAGTYLPPHGKRPTLSEIERRRESLRLLEATSISKVEKWGVDPHDTRLLADVAALRASLIVLEGMLPVVLSLWDAHDRQNLPVFASLLPS